MIQLLLGKRWKAISRMGLTMNCRAEYTPPCKHVHVYVFGPLSSTILSPPEIVKIQIIYIPLQGMLLQVI